MELFLDFAIVPVITVIVYWIIELIKQATNNNENFMRFIPIVATGIGVVLGVVIYFAVPEISIAANVLFAAVTGGASGLAATGSNQMIKQLKKYAEKEEEIEVPEETKEPEEPKEIVTTKKTKK